MSVHNQNDPIDRCTKIFFEILFVSGKNVTRLDRWIFHMAHHITLSRMPIKCIYVSRETGVHHVYWYTSLCVCARLVLAPWLVYIERDRYTTSCTGIHHCVIVQDSTILPVQNAAFRSFRILMRKTNRISICLALFGFICSEGAQLNHTSLSHTDQDTN